MREITGIASVSEVGEMQLSGPEIGANNPCQRVLGSLKLFDIGSGSFEQNRVCVQT